MDTKFVVAGIVMMVLGVISILLSEYLSGNIIPIWTTIGAVLVAFGAMVAFVSVVFYPFE